MSKYFKYAFGEILLVVIGILIALQINNWNQNRIENIEKEKIIRGLHAEFKQNRNYLKKIIEKYTNSKNSGIKLISFINKIDRKNLDKNKIDSLLDGIFPSVDYLPSNNAIEDIIQSGKLKNLNNSVLSSKLSDWKTLLYIQQAREEKLDKWAFQEVIPYLNKYISWRDIGVISNYGWSTKGVLPTNYQKVFQDLEFENILENQIYFIDACLKRYKEIKILAEEIINITEYK